MIKWKIYLSEMILLLLLASAGAAWLGHLAHYNRKNAVLFVPAAAADQTKTPLPQNMQTVIAGLQPEAYAAVLLEEESYYAGPSGNNKKEPEEIRVVIDPGHGGIDEGCARGGIQEKNVNLSIALEVQKRLKKLGYQVIMTRDTDESLSLGDRIQTAAEAHADIFVSIHQNSSNLSNVNGLEIYYSAKYAKEDSVRLSELIHQDVLAATGAKARSIFEWENIRVIRESRMPSCLIETGFLTNAAERRKLADSAYQNQIADGIVSGIDQYFRPDLKYLTPDPKASETDTKTMLSILEKQNIRAVFFVTREMAQKDPDAIKQMAEKGHTIGIYENRQEYQTIYENTDAYLADLKYFFETLTRLTGTEPTLYHEKEESRGNTGTADEEAEDVNKRLKDSGYIPYEWKPGF